MYHSTRLSTKKKRNRTQPHFLRLCFAVISKVQLHICGFLSIIVLSTHTRTHTHTGTHARTHAPPHTHARVKHSPMKARVLTGDVLLQSARKMGVETANGLDLWSIKLLKRLPAPFWDALAELLRVVERTGRWPERVAEGFTSLVPKGEGEGDPMKLRRLTVLLQIYRI